MQDKNGFIAVRSAAVTAYVRHLTESSSFVAQLGCLSDVASCPWRVKQLNCWIRNHLYSSAIFHSVS